MFIFREAQSPGDKARMANEKPPGAAPGRSRGARVAGLAREACKNLPGAAPGRSRGVRVAGFAREAC